MKNETYTDLEIPTKNEQLLNWIFNYNPYTQEWRGCKREDYLALFSQEDNENLLKSRDIKTLIEFITKEQ